MSSSRGGANMCTDLTSIMSDSRCYPRSQNRRRRRQGTINTTYTLTTYYHHFIAVILILCYKDGLIYHNIPYTVHSFQYDERYSIISLLNNSIFRIRGGDDDEDRIDVSRISQSIIDTSNPLTTDIDRIDIGNRKPSRGLWKRIRSIRGGVDDDEKSADDATVIDDSQEVESLESTTLKSDKDNVDMSVDANISADDSKKKHAGKPTKENKKQKKKTNSPQAAKKEGGVFTSFISLFRADPSKKSESNLKERPVVTDTSGIAHKIPHGPDGRGGGYATTTIARPKQSSSTEEDRHMEAEEDEFIITTDISTADATQDESTKPSSVGARGNSAAFVVPPSPKTPTQTTTVDKSKDDKKSKASKTIPVVVEEEVDTLSSNSTLNETAESTLDSANDTNTTGLDSSSNTTATVTDEISENTTTLQTTDYTSSGYWVGIDLVTSLGLSSLNDDLKISKALRGIRKSAAAYTGLHGFMSGKEYIIETQQVLESDNTTSSTVISIDEELGIHDTNAIQAEILARRVASRNRQRRVRNNNRQGRRWGFRRGHQATTPNIVNSDYVVVSALDTSPDALEIRRRKRAEEIDLLLQRGSERLQELQCERDDLLCAPNPLFNYTKKYDPSTNHTFGDVRTTREFNFPSPELVNEYIGELVSHGRLIRMNHTELWQSRSDHDIDDDDESVGDDLLTPGADVRKLYDEQQNGHRHKSGGGSWLLRTGFGGGNLGEKLGETIEINAYKGVCSAVMMVFARMLSSLHGVNVLSHSDIRTYVEQDPDLPPIDRKHGPILSGTGNDYAHEAIKSAIQKSARKKKKTKHRSSSRRHGHELSDIEFIQRDAVVETLISHCQISAPLLKLFPLDWQRAMVGNIITLATAIISDFADGLQVQILGHALTISFKPITEADLIQHIGVGGFRKNHRRTRPDEFEAAVLATAQDMSESLAFLDGWLEWVERRVGGGVLRSQIGNLIARVVLTLIDEVLSGARLDLWSSQANGPRLYAALEYRTTTSTSTNDVDEDIEEDLSD